MDAASSPRAYTVKLFDSGTQTWRVEGPDGFALHFGGRDGEALAMACAGQSNRAHSAGFLAGLRAASAEAAEWSAFREGCERLAGVVDAEAGAITIRPAAIDSLSDKEMRDAVRKFARALWERRGPIREE